MTIATICIVMAATGVIMFCLSAFKVGGDYEAAQDTLDYGTDPHTARLTQAIRDVEAADDRFLNSPFLHSANLTQRGQ